MMKKCDSGIDPARRKLAASLLFATSIAAGCKAPLKKQTVPPDEQEQETGSEQSQPTQPGYTVLDTPHPGKYETIARETAVNDPRIELVHFCGFTCRPCYKFDPLFTEWVSANASKVIHTRVAPALNLSWEKAARLFYALEFFGLTDRLYKPLFDKAQANAFWLRTDATIAGQVKFLDRSIDKPEFQKTLNSFAVNGQMRRDVKLAITSGVSSIPSVVVNGKYLTSPDLVNGNHEAMIDVIEELVAKEIALV